MIKIDRDGYAFLDYLGKVSIAGIKDELGEESLKKIFASAYKFVDDEYQRFKALRNQKLAQRYYLLRQYFCAREIK